MSASNVEGRMALMTVYAGALLVGFADLAHTLVPTERD